MGVSKLPAQQINSRKLKCEVLAFARKGNVVVVREWERRTKAYARGGDWKRGTESEIEIEKGSGGEQGESQLPSASSLSPQFNSHYMELSLFAFRILASISISSAHTEKMHLHMYAHMPA